MYNRNSWDKYDPQIRIHTSIHRLIYLWKNEFMSFLLAFFPLILLTLLRLTVLRYCVDDIISIGRLFNRTTYIRSKACLVACCLCSVRSFTCRTNLEQENNIPIVPWVCLVFIMINNNNIIESVLSAYSKWKIHKKLILPIYYLLEIQ